MSSEEEAVKLANDTPFGLGSYVMTTDPEQAERVADQIDAGMVYVNIVGADGAGAAVRRHEAIRLRPRARHLRRRRVREQEADPDRLTWAAAYDGARRGDLGQGFVRNRRASSGCNSNAAR